MNQSLFERFLLIWSVLMLHRNGKGQESHDEDNFIYFAKNGWKTEFVKRLMVYGYYRTREKIRIGK